MRVPAENGRPSLAANLLFGALLAGTLLYLVPTLALGGAVLAAIVAVVLWVGGLSAIWVLQRGRLQRSRRALEDERSASSFYRRIVDGGTEAYLVLDISGRVTFTSSNLARVLDVDPSWPTATDNVLELLRPAERRDVVKAFARARRAPGASTVVDATSARSDERDIHLRIRATNLMDEPEVAGILVAVQDVSLRKAFEADAERLAYRDALTGLPNRRFFLEHGARALSLARRHRRRACVLAIDLDRFQQVNDLVGQEAGDELLRRVADALRRAVRDTDVVARLVGDGFGVLLTEVRDAGAAGRVANRILEGMPLSAASGGHEVLVTASIGAAFFPDDGADLDALMAAAGAALDRARADNLTMQYYRPELRALLSDRLRLEGDMRRALERHEFQLHYQPVFDLATGAVVGAEALSRWRHFTRGMVAAAEFIGLAESSGLVHALDRWAIARAIHQRAGGPDGAFPGWVAVNLSLQSLMDDSLPAYIREVMDRYGAAPNDLVLELPHAAVGMDAADAARTLSALHEAGAAIALDDYGAAPVPSTRMRGLPVDIVKLDPEFVGAVGRGERDERAAESAIATAHGLGARVLAKAVERPEQAEWLRAAGCDLIQGYLMCAPLPPEELVRRTA